MTPLVPAGVIAQFNEGVAAIESAAEQRSGRDWHKTVVGEWSAHELARHLLVIVGWYHDWLDAALAGDANQPFPAKQLDGRNELAILDIRDLDGSEAIATFVEQAGRYADRLGEAADTDRWETPYGFANGVSTVGGHAGIAAAEWHLHAWDLSGAVWTPSDPASLYLAVGHGMTLTQPSWKRIITQRVVPRIAAGEPWLDLLSRSGRTRAEHPTLG